MSALVGVAVAALLTSVAEAGAAGDSRGGRSGSGGTVPWWYPSRDWGMLPSDYDGGGRGGWGGSGGGGGPGGWLGLRSVRFRYVGVVYPRVVCKSTLRERLHIDSARKSTQVLRNRGSVMYLVCGHVTYF